MLNDLSTLTNEVWSMIAEFPDYQVSNHGRVKHIYRSSREYRSSNRRGRSGSSIRFQKNQH